MSSLPLSGSNRFKSLDSLRGIAALSVVIFHFYTNFPDYYDKIGINLWALCSGVDLFFIISGFVIYLSISKTKDWKVFLFNRFSRIYPTYWVCLIITALIVWIVRGDKLLTTFLVNLTMLQHYLKIPSIDYAYWTLAVELNFYIIILILLLAKKVDWLQNIVVGLLIMGTLLTVWELSDPSSFYIIKPLSDALFHYQPLMAYSGLFLMGILFLRAFQVGFYSRTSIVLFVLSFVGQVIMHSKGYLGPHQTMFHHALEILFYMGVFFIVNADKSKFLEFKFFYFFGDISYPFYLIHQATALRILQVLVKNGMDFWLGLNICFFGMILLAYLIHKFVEKPSINYLRNWYKANLAPKIA